MRTHDLTLDQALEMCRAHKTSKTQMKTLTEGQETAAVIGNRDSNKERKKQQHKVNATVNSNHDPCPAIGKLCRKCNKPYHFAGVCHTKSST